MNISNIRQSIPPVTRNLIIINVLLWLAQIVFSRRGINLAELLGMHYWEAENFAPWQLFTYMFLHSEDSINHVFFNMFSVWMFGATIERFWGSKRYLLFYVITGVTAGIAQQAIWYIDLHQMAQHADQLVDVNGVVMPVRHLLGLYVTIGASGAVFGLLLAFGMLFPNSVLYLMLLPIPIKAKYFVIGYGLIELFLGVHPTLGGSVAHFAHLGGMIGGLILILLWRRRGIIDGPYN